MGRDYVTDKAIVYSLDQIGEILFRTDQQRCSIDDYMKRYVEENRPELEEDFLEATRKFLEADRGKIAGTELLQAFLEELDGDWWESDPVSVMFRKYFSSNYPGLPRFKEVDRVREDANVNAHEAGVPIDEPFFCFDSEGLFEMHLTKLGDAAAEAFSQLGLPMEEAEWVWCSF